jgi:hypothetical protein
LGSDSIEQQRWGGIAAARVCAITSLIATRLRRNSKESCRPAAEFSFEERLQDRLGEITLLDHFP